MSPATDWLANISVKWVLIAAGLLLALRMSLPRLRTVPRQWADSSAEFVESALIAIVLVFLIIRPFVVQAFYIPSGSMMNTLLIEDRILVNKFLFHFRPPKRSDIVVFHAPPEVSPDEKDFIKRVVGHPMDTIQVKPDTITIDGRPAIQLINEDARWQTQNFLKAEQHGLWVTKDRFPQIDGNVLSINNSPAVVASNSGVAEYRNGQLYVDGRFVTYVGIGNPLDTDSDLKRFGAGPDVQGQVYSRGLTESPLLIVLKGSRLAVKPGYVSVNGKPLNEPYVRQAPRYELPPFKVPRGRYFVMGDNRNDSNDSHAWGTLDERRIIGKAMLIFWPLPRVRILR